MTSKKDAEMNQWLESVADVSSAVDGLMKGTVTPAETEDLLRRLQLQNPKELTVEEKEEKRLAEQKQREEEARKGRRGKGAGEGYHWFCRACFLEFLPPEMDKCTQCKGTLISREERRAELMEKVGELKKRKEERSQRRERFQKWKQAQKDSQAAETKSAAKASKGAAKRGGLSTNYEAWDFWEPSSEEEEAPVVPDSPALQMMERDINERAERRRKADREAEAEKAKGNEAFGKKDFKLAAEHYSKCIELVRGEKVFYTNRAAAYLQLQDFPAAIKDCNTALEIWEFLEDKKRKYGNAILHKAYLRRAGAKRGLKLFKEALEDLDKAYEVLPTDKETIKQQAMCRADLAEAERAEKVLRQVGATKTSDLAPSAEVAATAAADAKAAAAKAAPAESKQLPAPAESQQGAAPASAAAASADTAEQKELRAQYERMQSILADVQALLAPPTDTPAKDSASSSAGAAAAKVAADQFVPMKRKLVELRRLMFSNQCRILLREHDGLRLLNRAAMSAAVPAAIARECLLVLGEACSNDHSKQVLVGDGGVRDLTAMLEKGFSELTSQPALQLLMVLSEHPSGRTAMDSLGTATLLYKYMGMARPAVQAPAVAILCNCAYESTFKARLRQAAPPAPTAVLSMLAPSLADALAQQKSSASSEGKGDAKGEAKRELKSSSGSGSGSDAAVALKLHESDARVDVDVQNRALGALANILTDEVVRQRFVSEGAGRQVGLVTQLLVREVGVWRSSPAGAFRPHEDWHEDREALLAKLLAVAMNLAVERPAHVELFERTPQIVKDLVDCTQQPYVPPVVRKRAMGLLSRCAKNEKYTASVVDNGGVPAMLNALVNSLTHQPGHGSGGGDGGTEFTAADGSAEGDIVDHATRGLAACGNVDKTATIIRNFLSNAAAKPVSGFGLIITLLRHPSSMVKGNAALIVSACAKEAENLEPLRGAIGPLIEIMKFPDDGGQRNAAVACARLAKHPSNLQRIRELDGMEVLYMLGNRTRHEGKA